MSGGEANRVRAGRGMNSAYSKLIFASLRFNSFTQLREYLVNPWKSVCMSVFRFIYMCLSLLEHSVSLWAQNVWLRLGRELVRIRHLTRNWVLIRLIYSWKQSLDVPVVAHVYSIYYAYYVTKSLNSSLLSCGFFHDTLLFTQVE